VFRVRGEIVRRIQAGLQPIGLERRAKPVPDLRTYLEQREQQKTGAAESNT
jgi:hypothetical protein